MSWPGCAPQAPWSASPPRADHWVRGGAHAAAVQAPLDRLYVQTDDSRPSDTRRVFLTWDLPPGVVDASVRLYVGGAGPRVTSATWEVRLIYDQWDAATLMWDGQPALGPPITAVTGQPGGTWVRFDVPAAVLAAAQGPGALSLGIRATAAAGGSEALAWFASSEAADPDHRPQLVCRTSTVLPATFAASSQREDPACDPAHAAISDPCVPLAPAWCPATDVMGSEWLEAEVGPALITAVEVEGRYAGAYWGYVTGYRVEVFDGVWTDVHYGAAFAGAFSQGCGRGRQVPLAAPVRGSRVRVTPLSYGGAWPSMRLRVHGLALADPVPSMAAARPAASTATPTSWSSTCRPAPPPTPGPRPPCASATAGRSSW